MQELEPPDSHILQAVLGWLELGNVKEARAEWRQIQPENRRHPDAMEVYWQLLAVERNWSAALSVAEKMRASFPHRPAGWICQSYTLHEMNRTQEALERLRAVAERFPREGTIPYNLACYACRLGALEEAQNWLRRAIGIKNRFRDLALVDPDLEALRKVIRKL